MKSRYIAGLLLVLSMGGLAAQYRVERATLFRQYYTAVHQEQPELNAWQRLMVSLALTTSK